ncbi:MAG: FtsK/SpoIIIE domain-containing protein [Spirochaetes bacterium]|nr:FtsK/SpoIIIE domain-containing protein [Spirochaetota bacterium]
MSKITYQTVLRLINNINSFAEQSDQRIQQLWNNFENSKKSLEEQYNQFMSNAAGQYDSSANVTRKKGAELKNNAEKIYKEVLALDTSLANADKYYVKARDLKTEELGKKAEITTIDDPDIFLALENVKKQFESLSLKYSKEKLPALFDGINFAFSKQRKQDYEDLIVLKIRLENLMEEIKKTIAELVNDSTQAEKDAHAKKTEEIESKYQAELSKIKSRYESNVEILADEICEQLDKILPDSLLGSLKTINERYISNFTGITSSYCAWDDTIVLGNIDYPLELFVSSKILFSLIKDKCAAIISQSKLLRFPLVFSLSDNLNLLVKYTVNSNLKNQLVSSIIQSFIAFAPVTHLTFSIIDSEGQGKNVSSYMDFIKKIPELFNGGVKTSNEEIRETLEKLSICNNTVATPDIKVLIVFDSPEALGDKNVASINNIIENGKNLGVYTVIVYRVQSGNALPPYHVKNSIIIQQAVDMFLYYNLRVTYNEALAGNDLSRYIKNYLFTYSSFHGNIALLGSIVCELIDSENADKVQFAISAIKNTLDRYNNTFGVVPSVTDSFPAEISVGYLSCPLDLVADNNTIARIKTELTTQNSQTFILPAIFNLKEKSSLLIICPEAVQQHVIKFIHGLMWSFLSSVPVSKIKFCVFDAERRGNSITPFLDFRQNLPDIFDGQIYTTQDAMIGTLQKLNRYIDEFIQEKLGNRFANIIEYNSNTPNRIEPIIMLIIFDFPRNFDNRSIELLINILNNGSKCGIYAVICHNPNILFSKYESIDEHLEEIKKHCSLLEYVEKKYILQPFGLQVDVAPELSKNRISDFINQYIEAITNLKQKGLSLEDIISPSLFSSSTAKRLSITVGIGDGENPVDLILGEGSSHHGIIAGATGSGKSTLLHTIIMSGMLSHSPDELHLYLMDFKSGTEFKIYESFNLPHIQLLALDAMQEFGESILENLVSEMLRRGDLFKNSGQSSLFDYIKGTGNPLPRILVVMDEFQILFNDSANRKVARNCSELTKRIVTEGRAFGIHLLMATQTTKIISELTLSHGIIEQMRIRIGLKCGEDDIRYLFGNRNDDKIIEMMKGPIGTAVMNLEYMESNNIGFRAAYCSKKAQIKYLSLISEKYADYPATMQIFEGNRTVSLVEYLNQSKTGSSSDNVIKIYMGTLIKVAPPFIMQFDRRRRHNLLICGANEKMAENLTNLCMFSALLNTNTNVYCIDGESLIGESISAAFYDCLTGFSLRFRTAKNRTEIIQIINDLFTIYSERKKGGDNKQSLVVIKNLQFLDLIKKMFKGESVDESEYIDNIATKSVNEFADFGVSGNAGSPSLSISEKLLQLIDDGSNYGIYFITSSLEYQSVKENMYYGENILSKFPARIIFALSNSDADNLIDGVAVAGLKDNTVYYSDGVKNIFQYKPYIMPDNSELKKYIKSLSIHD